MRWLVACLLLSLVPVAAGHGGEHTCDESNQREGWTHLRLWEDTVEGNASRLMAWDFGCPLREDWWVSVWIDAQGPMDLAIDHEGARLLDADVPAGTSVHHVQLPVAGFPELHLNAAAPTAFRAYFDQTCECPVKGVPVTEGPAWFNVDAPAGATVQHDFRLVPVQVSNTDAGRMPRHINVTIQHVEPSTDGLRVLDEEVHRFDTQSAGCGPEGGLFQGCIEHRFASTGDMQYLWVTVEHDGTAWAVSLRPTIDVEEQAPGPAVVWLLAACVALAAWARR